MNTRRNVLTGPGPGPGPGPVTATATAMKTTVAASSALAESTVHRCRTRRPGADRRGHPHRGGGGRRISDAVGANAAAYDDEQVVQRPDRHH
ncbi:hypothetical protein OG468_33585 [Streptomyces zaomyceticus]|uniref:hypothetical protein n=1 Tax=Streptomyces zaomyceticus TaxID=68286 RepID=UPI003252BF0D